MAPTAWRIRASNTVTDAPREAEPRVGLTEHATAFDIEGREALWGQLRTQSLAGTPDAQGHGSPSDEVRDPTGTWSDVPGAPVAK